ncbi:MAG: peptidylprolyl isomerase [Clostridia bacterium]|nr:peptidylprolyl isomerase [Clostridia bacterium]
MRKLFLIFMSVVLFSSCTVSDDIALKIDDVNIKNEFIEYFENSFNTQSGGTVSETVAKQAHTQAELYGKVMAIGRKMKLDAEPEYNSRVEAVIANYGSVDEYLKKADISKELFDFLMYGTSYQTLVLQEFVKTLGISEDVFDAYFKSNYYRAKHLLLLTGDKTSSEKAELKNKINEIYAEAKNGADFDKLIAEYNEDPGVKNSPDGYVFTDNEMVQEFFDGVAGIGIGEYAVVETMYGYHVVKRLPLDETYEHYDNLKKEKMINICQSLIIDKYFKENFWRTKQILLSTKNKSADEIAAIEEKAERLFEEVQDDGNFEALMAQYNEDTGVADNPNGYVFTYGDMVEEFFNAVSGIEIGEYNLVETMYGYHIVKRLPLDETPELYNEFKKSKLDKIQSSEEVDINQLFLDYINSKLDEFNIQIRDYTGMY